MNQFDRRYPHGVESQQPLEAGRDFVALNVTGGWGALVLLHHSVWNADLEHSLRFHAGRGVVEGDDRAWLDAAPEAGEAPTLRPPCAAPASRTSTRGHAAKFAPPHGAGTALYGVARHGAYLREWHFYRQLPADAIVWRDSALLLWAHSEKPDNAPPIAGRAMRSVALFYHRPGARGATRSDFLDVGAPRSEREHGYGPGAAASGGGAARHRRIDRFCAVVAGMEGTPWAAPHCDEGTSSTGSRFDLALDPSNRGALLRRRVDRGWTGRRRECAARAPRRGRARRGITAGARRQGDEQPRRVGELARQLGRVRAALGVVEERGLGLTRVEQPEPPCRARHLARAQQQRAALGPELQYAVRLRGGERVERSGVRARRGRGRAGP